MTLTEIIKAKQEGDVAKVDAGELSELIEAHLDVVSGGGYSRTSQGHSKSANDISLGF